MATLTVDRTGQPAARTGQPAARQADEPTGLLSRTVPLMGGRVGVHIRPADGAATSTDAAETEAILGRISVWADRLTRFTATSELSRLNRDPRDEVPVGPTLAAILDWGRYAEGLTGGVVDIGLLDARLESERVPDETDHESPLSHGASEASRSWSLDRRARGAVVRRPVGLRFDLDGIGKGWLADRAIDRLDRHPAAVVDADGDVAIRLGAGVTWAFGVADPRIDEHDLAVLRLAARNDGSPSHDGRFGLATSGTSVHRWVRGGRTTHHLIDPRTGRSAATDVIQATVLAHTARQAEALAKSAVILGAAAGYELLERVGVDGAILLTNRDELVIHPATLRWLA